MKASSSVLQRGRFVGTCVVVVVGLLLGSLAVQAQTTAQGADRWQYNLAVYAWGVGISGDLGPNAKQYEVHSSTGDVFKALDFAAMVHFEADNDCWGILVDPLYANFGKTVDNQGRRRERTIDLNLEAGILGVAGSYKVCKGPGANLDFTFGARYVGLSTDIEPRRISPFHKSYSWVDPVIGLRGTVKMSKSWTFVYRADVGGFGVGSDLTWSGILNLDAQVSETVSINFGYIALYNDYKTGSGPREFRYDAALMGPFLGVGFNW